MSDAAATARKVQEKRRARAELRARSVGPDDDDRPTQLRNHPPKKKNNIARKITSTPEKGTREEKKNEWTKGRTAHRCTTYHLFITPLRAKGGGGRRAKAKSEDSGEKTSATEERRRGQGVHTCAFPPVLKKRPGRAKGGNEMKGQRLRNETAAHERPRSGIATRSQRYARRARSPPHGQTGAYSTTRDVRRMWTTTPRRRCSDMRYADTPQSNWDEGVGRRAQRPCARANAQRLRLATNAHAGQVESNEADERGGGNRRRTPRGVCAARGSVDGTRITRRGRTTTPERRRIRRLHRLGARILFRTSLRATGGLRWIDVRAPSPSQTNATGTRVEMEGRERREGGVGVWAQVVDSWRHLALPLDPHHRPTLWTRPLVDPFCLPLERALDFVGVEGRGGERVDERRVGGESGGKGASAAKWCDGSLIRSLVSDSL
ncbi:hypothetical protein B0H16DRAFT_1459546 [Mycena metata]|uniref:Uncharacterized protein n=1 Tax=Mycena metata TaxID=1033252 RepID=A0AAD7J0L2_9AGAR|nr:hypothetical protein B0H16DRAFT_1459546 [Mycena metata]